MSAKRHVGKSKTISSERTAVQKPSSSHSVRGIKSIESHEPAKPKAQAAVKQKSFGNGVVDGFQGRKSSRNQSKMLLHQHRNNTSVGRKSSPLQKRPTPPSSSSSVNGRRHQKPAVNHEVAFVNKETDNAGDGTTVEDGSRKPSGRIIPREILEQAHENEVTKVYEVDLHSANIGTINNLEMFLNLRVLDLSCNCIRNIENLDNNRDLRELKLYDNKITAIANLERLPELCSLQLQHNKIRTIGRGLATMRKLKILRLDSNYIGKIESRELGSCSQLTYLDISSNTLDNLSALNALSSLEELHATHNCLRAVTDLKRCKQLQEVNFSNNKLTDISGLKGLHNLAVLRLSHNSLTSQHLKGLERLRSLQTLDVSHNKITDVSFLADQFPNLEVLNVSDNKIEKWSTVLTLHRCECLSELFVSGNPFSLQGGEKPSYHPELQATLLTLEILDGAVVKRNTSSKAAPVMRPMSASTVVSARQVENQLKNSDQDLAAFFSSLTTKFENLRATLGTLPAEPPSYRPMTSFSDDLSIRSVSSMSDGRPGSRCNSRNRIAAAKAYASQHF